MDTKEKLVKLATKYIEKNGLSRSVEDVVITIHIANQHKVSLTAAQDQSSHGPSDCGIDGWHYDEVSCDLFIYQSKLSENKALALSGLQSLIKAAGWLEQTLSRKDEIIKGNNPCLYNLKVMLGNHLEKIKTVHFVLVSLFDDSEIGETSEYESFKDSLAKTELMKLIIQTGGNLRAVVRTYSTDDYIPHLIKSYPVRTIKDTRISLRDNTHLDLSYVSLYSLVKLFKVRGILLFEKNVRLFLNSKDSKMRLEAPMEETLEAICDKRLSHKIFPYYHIGITIAATAYSPFPDGHIELENPSVINGCQTINVAARFVEKLERNKDIAALNIFKQIQVIAKIVTGASDDELREITNCNNRQNPIDSWQLYSNDPIHVQIEDVLKRIGVFYERQKGKFNSIRKDISELKYYGNTNDTYIGVQDLGQIISLCSGNIKLASKSIDVFASKTVHDEVFGPSILSSSRDMVWSSNAFKAAKRGLQNYLRMPAHDNEATHSIFNKAAVRQNMYYLAIMNLYQSEHCLPGYAVKLNKIAPATLVSETESFYKKIIYKTKSWYMKESSSEVSGKKIDAFVRGTLCSESGLNPNGKMPFVRPVQWQNLFSENA